MHLSRQLMFSLFGGWPWPPWRSPFTRLARRCMPCEPRSSGRRWSWPRASSGPPNKCFKTALQANLQALVGQFQNHEHLAGVAIHGADGRPVASTPGLAFRLGSNAAGTPRAVSRGLQRSSGLAAGANNQRRADSSGRPFRNSAQCYMVFQADSILHKSWGRPPGRRGSSRTRSSSGHHQADVDVGPQDWSPASH